MKTMEEFDQMLKEDDIKLSNEINKLMKIRQNKIDCAIIAWYLIKDVESLINYVRVVKEFYRQILLVKIQVVLMDFKLTVRIVKDNKVKIISKREQQNEEKE